MIIKKRYKSNDKKKQESKKIKQKSVQKIYTTSSAVPDKRPSVIHLVSLHLFNCTISAYPLKKIIID